MAERVNPWLVFGLLAAVGVYIMSQTKTGQSITQAAIEAGVDVFSGPRGIRNNNPGNIVRSGATWVGMASEQPDSHFVTFDAPEYGIRAMARVLKNYMLGGYNTVASIINRWAPPVENDTGAYVRSVASSMGVDPNMTIDASYLEPLIAAIIQHENGQQPYDQSVIALGIQLEQTA